MRTGHERSVPSSADHGSIQSPVLFPSIPSFSPKAESTVLGFYSFIEIDPKRRREEGTWICGRAFHPLEGLAVKYVSFERAMAKSELNNSSSSNT